MALLAAQRHRCHCLPHARCAIDSLHNQACYAVPASPAATWSSIEPSPASASAASSARSAPCRSVVSSASVGVCFCIHNFYASGAVLPDFLTVAVADPYPRAMFAEPAVPSLSTPYS